MVKNGHVYKTIVVDLKTGRIEYVGESKGDDSVSGFEEFRLGFTYICGATYWKLYSVSDLISKKIANFAPNKIVNEITFTLLQL